MIFCPVDLVFGNPDKMTKSETADNKQKPAPEPEEKPAAGKSGKPTEIGGRKGPEPTRYGDWEKNGLISDF